MRFITALLGWLFAAPDYRRRAAMVLVVEQLELRAVPASFLWHPTDSRNLWSLSEDWDKQDNDGNWVPVGKGKTAPGSSDDALFTSDHNVDCVVDLDGSVRNVTVTNSYSAKLILQNPLTVGNGLASGLKLDATGAVICGPLGANSGQGKLYIHEGSQFNWLSGVLRNVDLRDEYNLRPYTEEAPVRIEVPNTSGARVMTATNITTDGELNWLGGSVTVNGQKASSVTINRDGTFQISPDGGSWGVDEGAPTSLFTIRNTGTVLADTPATLRGDFLNTNVVQINAGTLTFGGKAEQAGGTFTIAAGATASLAGTDHALRIYGGLLTGSGTVAGNLTLGTDPNPAAGALAGATPPVVRPGTGDDFTTLSVTLSFQLFNGTAQFRIGDNNQSSKLAVGGNNHLGLIGTLAIDDRTTRPLTPRPLFVLIPVAGTTDGIFGGLVQDAVAATPQQVKVTISYSPKDPNPNNNNYQLGTNGGTVFLQNKPPVGVRLDFPMRGAAAAVLTEFVMNGVSDPEGDSPLTVSAFTQPAHGTVTVDDDGTFTYHKDNWFVGVDTFTFTPNDPFGPGAPVTVTITVTDTPPIANAVFWTLVGDAPVTYYLAAHDQLDDPDYGDEYAVVAVDATPVVGPGTVSWDGMAHWDDGCFITYTPPAGGYDGPVQIDWVVSDGVLTTTGHWFLTCSTGGPGGDD